MRLLIFTQKVDSNDSVLGFFHTWIIHFSKIADSIEVICLEKGEFDLPKNVTVYSLGKERDASKLGYIKNFYAYLRLISGTYDSVFVHMNQEYILLGGLYWRLKNIPVYFWRNHPDGSLLSRTAVGLSTKVFCTSTKSFTAQFKKTIIMPAGIDLELFKLIAGSVRKKYSVCMVGRLAPVKHNELALEALKILTQKGVQVSLTFVGGFLDRDSVFVENLHKYVEKNNLSNIVQFVGPVSPDKLPEIYSSHEICLNLTEAGSFDKTIVEAASCGAVLIVSSRSFERLLPEVCITENSAEEIAISIERLLVAHEQLKIAKDLEDFTKSQSLSFLMDKLASEIR